MISVIIPLYNKELTIARCINSVLKQNYEDCEIVIVDDGSSDNGPSIVRDFHDNRIILVTQENAGPAAARNTGVKSAHGNWILFLDADDELLPQSIETFVNISKQNKDVEFINASYYVDDGNRKTLYGAYMDGVVSNNYKDHARGLLIPRAGTMYISRKIALQHPFDERIRRFEDLEHLLNLYKETKVYTSKVPTAIIHTSYAEASCVRKNIREDFMGYLSLEGKTFWEQMCIYKLFIEQRENYNADCHRLYPQFYKRWDLYITYQLIHKLHFPL